VRPFPDLFEGAQRSTDENLHHAAKAKLTTTITTTTTTQVIIINPSSILSRRKTSLSLVYYLLLDLDFLLFTVRATNYTKERKNMSSSYRRVPQRDGSGIAGSAGSSDSLEANVTQSRSERLQDKLVARKLC
jgi:hypothetical protein